MSYTGSNFVSEKSMEFCRNVNIEQPLSSSYHYRSNRQVKAYIKLFKQMLKKYFDTNTDMSLALLLIRATLLGLGLPSPATLLLICPARGIVLVINRSVINTNNNDEHYEELVPRQYRTDENYDTVRDNNSILLGSTLAVQWNNAYFYRLNVMKTCHTSFLYITI